VVWMPSGTFKIPNPNRISYLEIRNVHFQEFDQFVGKTDDGYLSSDLLQDPAFSVTPMGVLSRWIGIANVSFLSLEIS